MTSTSHSTFGGRLRSSILGSDFDLTSFADRVGWTPSHISRLVCNRATPTYDTMTTLLSALPHVDARWLLLGDGDTTP